MKSKFRFFGIMIFAVAIAFSIAGCNNGTIAQGITEKPGGTVEDPTEIYSGTKNGATYILMVYLSAANTAHAVGDKFTLTIMNGNTVKTCSGKLVGVTDTTLSALPSYENAEVFTITISGTRITFIQTVSIAFNDGSTEQGPGSFTTSSGGGGGGSGGGSKGGSVGSTAPSSVAVTGVSLNKSSLTLLVGDMEDLIATITPTNATNQNVTWSSSNTSIATVSEGGVVTAVAPGKATITVKTEDGGKKADCAVTVNPISVTGITLKSSTSLVVGSTENLYAEINPPDATNKNVTWSSSNTAVATVSANGVVTAVSAGTATITVKTADGNKTATCNVSVVTGTVAVTGVSLNKSSISLNVGSMENLFATITPSTATNQNVTWSSSNTAVATVNNGTVTAVAPGTATITVKTQDGNKTATCTVTVNPIPVSSVSLKKTTSLDVGGTETLYADIEPANASNQKVTWSSSNSSVATVSASGLVTAVAPGTATITVKTDDGGKTAACTVTVNPHTATFNSVSANGSSTQTTTQLTLTFDKAIVGLTASNITLSGVSGVSKGTLSGSGTSYTLPISGFTTGGTLSVSIASPAGYSISGSPKTVTIYYYAQPTVITFNSVTANGSSTQTTTQLTLTFDKAITGLTASNITLSGVSGASKGTLSGSGTSYTLPISGFTVGGTLSVSVGSPSGYSISGSPKTATIYYYAGSGTAALTITFAQFTDASPSIVGPTLYRVSNGGPTSATLTVANPSQYDSISWRVDNTTVTGTGSPFTLNSANTAYNLIGDHFVTVTVRKSGVPYNKTVSFKVAY